MSLVIMGEYIDYSWILDVEKKILEYWMRTGITNKCAKEKEYDDINMWCVYEDSYDKYTQSCFILVRNIRLAKSMSVRLNKVIKELGLEDYFWADYGRGNTDYDNAPLVIIGMNHEKVNDENLKLLHTVLRIMGNNYQINGLKDLLKKQTI